MDWGVRSGIATVVAVSDGTASIYYSTGGGSIGGGQSHRSIRNAALDAVTVAGKLAGQMWLTDQFPLPKDGEDVFYVLIDGGVVTARGSQDLLSSNQHLLSKLGNAMQEIVTQYRLI
jgi:hypothetical protein